MKEKIIADQLGIDTAAEKKIWAFLDKNLIAVILTIFLLIIAAGTVFFIRPKLARNNELQKIIAEKKSALVLAENDYQNIDQEIKAFAEINQADLDKLETVLPSKAGEEKFYGQIAALLGKNGLIANNIDVKDESDDPAKKNQKGLYPGVGSFLVDLNIGAIDYVGVKNLLALIEQNLRLLDVQNLTFSPAKGTLNLSFRTYYYKK